MEKPVLALQLYTVRQSLAEDFAGTLRRVRQVGYDAVELTGTGPFGGRELGELLDELGLRVAGMHVGIETLRGDLTQAIELARVLQTQNIVCPFLPEELRRTRDDWVAAAHMLDEIGRRCREEGLRLSYHNHSFEFVRFDGQAALDLLFENCSAENVWSELDTYWVKHGGEDPVAYIERYAGRINILHCKDMAADAERSFTEVGRGILDWQAIDEAARRAGVEWYCVEQDVCPADPFESARISAEFMRRELRL